ncbi:uncharacterized protein LOC132558189 [Ylistrum balloti]|uniref:uncharacterized protein LOC132558189 n=1 Tax=Ylistrum balloti TaxID=509963 RepID=UPI0029058709|nr:uncharacterized protein LOC132558189 [Ylistrum balloti]
MDLEAEDVDKYIFSPSYGSYANNIDMCYRILALEDRVIVITLEHVDLEDQSGNCVDYLDILDGDHSRSASLGRFCQVNSTIIQTTSDEAYLRFRTDQQVTRTGFKLRYRQSADTEVSMLTPALAGVAGGIALILIVLCCCCLCPKKHKVTNRDASAVHPIQHYSTEDQSRSYRQSGDRISRPRIWEDRQNTNIYHVVLRPNRVKQERIIKRTNVEPTKPPVYEEKDTSPEKPPAYDDLMEDEFSRIISPPPSYREHEQGDITLPMSPPPAYPITPSPAPAGHHLQL